MLPWCIKVGAVRFNASPLSSVMAILPSLSFLRELEFVGLTFSSVTEYFELLASLLSTVKDLRYTRPVNRRIEPTRLHTDSAADLAALLRDDCPVSLASLRVASLRHPRLQDFEAFIRRIPFSSDLSIEVGRSSRRTVPIPLIRFKSLSIIDHSHNLWFLSRFLATPSNLDSDRSDIASPLETLNITFSCNNWFSPPQLFRDIAVHLSQQPRFHNLKTLRMNIIRVSFRHESWGTFDNWVHELELDLEATGRIRSINITTELVVLSDETFFSYIRDR
ncbi:hypothetical protein EV421DRAFT_1851889 [Armillaria borealis]|uniref:Uncharacterized protein n=1 Tax=Armillaria borealis TaxID=47425 RepID=A0AA39IZ48_9AGAR|nr:hypothetical protein EV421DRAFT_1851889 [Armillaria borealis]